MALLSQFGADLQLWIDFRPRFDIAPTQKFLAERQPGLGVKREPVELWWGGE